MRTSRLLFVVIAYIASPAVARSQGADSTRYPCRSVQTFDYWVGTFDAKPWDKPDAPSGGQLRTEYQRAGEIRHAVPDSRRQRSASLSDTSSDACSQASSGC